MPTMMSVQQSNTQQMMQLSPGTEQLGPCVPTWAEHCTYQFRGNTPYLQSSTADSASLLAGYLHALIINIVKHYGFMELNYSAALAPRLEEN